MSTENKSLNNSVEIEDDYNYRCANCLINFQLEQDYKSHHRSEFHKYNMLRKMVNLPIVTEEQFTKHQNAKKLAVKTSIKPTRHESYFCTSCTKKFSNTATLNQHLATKKHIEKEKSQQSKTKQTPSVNEIEVTEETIREDKTLLEEEEVVRSNPLKDQNACLFCNKLADSFAENFKHMEIKHGFFVTDKNFCKNLNGLYTHLANKIYKEKLCIFCENHKCGGFKSGLAVQNHMVDRGHCFMNLDYFAEFDNFYDFTEDNERIAKEMEVKYGNLHYGAEVDYEISDKEKSEDEEGEWEDEEEGDGEKEMTEDKEPKAKAQTKKVYKLRRARLLDTDELLLPSGKIVGHKKYLRYYKQRAIIHDHTQLRLTSGRVTYTGKKSYQEALELRNRIRGGGCGQLAVAQYNRYLMRERMKVDKHLKKTDYKREAHNWMRYSFILFLKIIDLVFLEI